MIAIPTVISLRFKKSTKPVGYLMVQTDDFETAVAVARRWGEAKELAFDSIMMHQGVMKTPLEHVEEFEGFRVCELPF